MDLKAQYRKKHAEFPWLSLDDPRGVETCLAEQGLLEPGEGVESIAKAGEGNMNLTLRVGTNRRTLVLKQARPWVEKYDHIPAPWDRILFEQRYYRRTASIPRVAERSPKILGVDAGARTIAMEYLEDARDFNDLYEGATAGRDQLEGLARYLFALHGGTRGTFDESLANREMRALNHEHIFVIPLTEDNGLELDAFEPGLDAAAAALKKDAELHAATQRLGQRYLADGPCLLHGDFFPGSWLRTARGLVVIDPEFCFFGDPEFDVGIALAHFAMAQLPQDDARFFLAAYESGESSLDRALLGQFAGVEAVRRLIGVARLPIPPTADFRVPLLERARVAILESRHDALWC